MNVVHVITGLGIGGAEGALYRLCTLGKDDTKHTVIALSGRDVNSDRLEAAGIAVHCLEMPRGQVTLRGLYRLFQLIRRLRPTLVQTWMYHADLLGGVVARLSGVRAVVWGVRGPLLAEQTSRKTRFVARCCALLSSIIPARIISNSAFAVETHCARGYRRDKFVVIANGFAVDRFVPDERQRAALRAQLGLSDEVPVIGMVARFHPYKDHSNLLAALRLLKERGHAFQCLVVGPGVEELQMPIAADGLAGMVSLLGSRDDIPAIMNALDIHVLSSVGEAFPNVLAEAMSCGIPCVATNVGDVATIIGNTGWLVPPRRPDLLAKAVAQALEARRDNHAWAKRRAACRERILTNFTLSRMCDAFQQLWTQAVTTKHGPAGS